LRYKVLKMLKSTEVKPALLVTPVLECVEGGYRTHHIDVMECYQTRRFVPIKHVSNQRRRILDLEDENDKLRELVEALLQCAGETKRDKGCDACSMYDADGDFLVKDSWCRLHPTLRELEIEVDE